MAIRKKTPFFQTSSISIDPQSVYKLIARHKEFQEKFRTNEMYYSDEHKILSRQQKDDSKPNNKIIQSLPAYTVDIRTGYFSGEPLTFACEDEEQQEQITNILEYNDFQDINSELDHYSSIHGQAFLIVYIDDDNNIRLAVETADNCFVIHDNSLSKNMIGAIRYYEYEDVVDNEIKMDVRLYTKDKIYHFKGPETSLTLVIDEDGKEDVQPHDFGDVPVIEFVENAERRGCFEKQITLVDAIESILSSSINEVEYFDNAYLLLRNLSGTEESDIDDMKNNRVMLVDEDGDAKFLTKEINDTYIQNNLNRLVADYHKLTKTPPLTDENFAGQTSGVALKFKLFGLEKDMAKKESKWRKSIQRMLEIVTNILNIKNGSSYDYRKIKITFTRSLPTNITETADMVSKLSGMLSDETLISQLDFVENAKTEIEKRNKEQEEQVKNMDLYNDFGSDKDKLLVNKEELTDE